MDWVVSIVICSTLSQQKEPIALNLVLIIYSIISAAAKLASHQNGEPSESHGREKHHYPRVSALIILKVNWKTKQS
jgi:hypothetical protein